MFLTITFNLIAYCFLYHWNVVDDDSEGSMKIEDRKGQLRWNATMDDILFNILGEAAREGKKSGKKWDTTVWNDLIAALSEKTIEKVKSSHIENRLRQMRKEYVNFMALRGKSGVSYDRIKQMIVAPQGFWDDILSNSVSYTLLRRVSAMLIFIIGFYGYVH